MNAVTHKIIIMFVIMVVGFICGKAGLITPSANSKMSELLLFLVLPLTTFVSYLRDYSSEIAKNLLLSLILAAVIHGISVGLALILITKKSHNREVEIMTAVFSNCAFVGIPIVESVFGSDGIIFLTMYVTVMNIVVWTYGVTLMTGENTLKDTLHHLCTPAIIAVGAGLLFFFCRIPLPDVIKEPLKLIGDMNTPLSMIVAGATLSKANFKEVLHRPRILYIAALRQILFPAAAALIAALFVKLGASPMPMTAVVIGAACPTAVVNVNFALKYQMDGVYASEIFAFSTVICAGTIPLILEFMKILGAY